MKKTTWLNDLQTLLMLIFLAYKNFHHAQLSNHLFFLVSSAAQDFFIQLRCENEQKETSKTGLEQRMNPVCSVCFIINEKPLKSLYAEIRKATKQSRQWSRAAIAFSEFSDLLNDRSEYSWADGGWINVNLSLWMFLSPALVLVFINFSMSAVEFVFNVEREIKVLVGTALEVFFVFFLAIPIRFGFLITHRSLSAKTNFRSLRSRSTIPCSWHVLTISHIWRNRRRASFSRKRLRTRTCEWRSPCEKAKVWN